MRLKLLISFAYPYYDYSKEIIVAFTVEGQVSRDDERYLLLFILRLWLFGFVVKKRTIEMEIHRKRISIDENEEKRE